MRKLILLLVLVLVAAPAVAQPMPGLKLSGPHYQFNIIGHPKGISGDDGNGRAIMVPLKNAGSGGVAGLTCADSEIQWEDDITSTATTAVPAGARIHFQSGDTFAILDRDATDGDALIQIPFYDAAADENQFDIYLRVLGKPNTCMNINAFAYDADSGTGGIYFWAGSVTVNRKTGKSTWVKVNYLFDVLFCDIDPATNQCIAGTTEEYSVFNDVFEDYFWNIVNNGTRNVQVRIYPWYGKQ